MDADRFDALSRRVAAPTTRRATLGAMAASGLLGALGVARAAPAAQDEPQGQVCTMALVAAVRMGPSLNQTIAPGGTQPGQVQGTLRFSLAKNGNLEQASLTLPDNTRLPVVGQATGHALQLRIAVDQRTAIVAMGVGEAEIEQCQGAVDGTTVGPQGGDLGEWHARAQGLTGEAVAAGGGNKKRNQAGRSGGGGQGGRQSNQGGRQGGQGGQVAPQGPTDDGGRAGRENRRRGAAGPTGPQGAATATPMPTPTATPTPTPAAVAQAACAAGLTRCGDACVDLMTDQLHCGECSFGCEAGVACVAGICGNVGEICPPGLVDCGGGCTDRNTDPANCGFCGLACAPGETCEAGFCAGPDGCIAFETNCGGVCVDTLGDPNNCGACGVVCAVGEECIGAMCTPTAGVEAVGCAAQGLMDCAGLCVDLAADPFNCGGCGFVCAGGDTCSGGFCVAPAAALDCASQGLLDCGGVCVDAVNDSANCGACGVVCAEGALCFGGSCV